MWEFRSLFLFDTEILGFLTILKNFQASSTLKQWTPRGFRVVKGMLGPFLRWSEGLGLYVGLYMRLKHPFILWCERWACMKLLQGNLDFILIRATGGPFRLKHKTQGPFHIYIPKGKLLLRCLWKDGLPLQSKTGNQLSSPDDMGCPDLSSCCFTDIDVPIDLRWVSQGISGLL